MRKAVLLLVAMTLAAGFVPPVAAAVQTEAGSTREVRVEVGLSNVPAHGRYVIGQAYEITTLAVQQGSRLDPRGRTETFFYVVYWNDRYVATGPDTLQLTGAFMGEWEAPVDTFVIDRDLGSATLDAVVGPGSCIGSPCDPRHIEAIWTATGPSEVTPWHLSGWYQLGAGGDWIDVRPSEDPDFRLTTTGRTERRPATAEVSVNATPVPAATFLDRSELWRRHSTHSLTCFTDRCPFD
jgi:hypothetical protein